MKKTKEQVIDDFNIVHNFKYGYSLMEYINAKIDIKIICPEHGIFEQRPDHHLSGSGCQDCKKEKLSKLKLNDNEYFINKSKIIHNGYYGYKFTNYTGAHNLVTITCPEHGNFEQLAMSHLRGYGCQDCGNKKMGFDRRNKEEDVIKLANEVHNFRYNYSLVEYINAKTNIKIICPEHGVFEKSPNHHISKRQGCPDCYESIGEKSVESYLKLNKIEYIKQKIFKDCRYIKPLRFDFYLPDYNMCIEFDGIQHFIINEYFGGEKELKKTQIRDKIKNEYCSNNNIRLLRISYKDINKIEDILLEFIKL